MSITPHKEINWNPDFLGCSPIFNPLKPIGEHLKKTSWPTHDDLAKLLQSIEHPITSESGALIRFVEQTRKPDSFSEKYEPKIYLTGEVSTRLRNWHDLFNTLVWLTFPKTKAAINKKHYLELQQQQIDQQKNRGQLQDLLTLFDESGAIVVCSNPELSKLLKQKKWKQLFWGNRDHVLSNMKFYLFGHALYEKALQPYTGMTGKCIILPVENDFFVASIKQQIQKIDLLLSEYFSRKHVHEIKQDLFPLPLLGVPGWSIENEIETYYDDKNYFR